MPFSEKQREEVLLKSGRCCCVCHHFVGREAVVHHIVPEADGGSNLIENAIPLCFKCHAEAGHYNTQHPLGTKYSPQELRKHRDAWFEKCEILNSSMQSLREQSVPLPPRCAKFEVVECKVGTLWSHLVNETVCRDVIRFHGTKLGGYCQEGVGFNFDEWGLFLVQGGRFLVYHKHIERGDYCWANLLGKGGEMDSPLSLEELHEEYPELASSVGMERIRVLDV